MRYHFFLHYGWFFKNLGKEAVRTFMHTTVLNRAELGVLKFTLLNFLYLYDQLAEFSTAKLALAI